LECGQAGYLNQRRVFLEQMGRLKTLLMDKTGTLTQGRPKVVEIKGLDGVDEKKSFTGRRLQRNVQNTL